MIEECVLCHEIETPYSWVSGHICVDCANIVAMSACNQKWISVKKDIPDYRDFGISNNVFIKYNVICDKCGCNPIVQKTSSGYLKIHEEDGEGCARWFLSEPLDDNFLPEFYLIEVTHWMSIPEMPNEQ